MADQHLNLPLLQAVPTTALRILAVGGAHAGMAKALRESGPAERKIFAIARNAATDGAQDWDAVYRIDVKHQTPPVEPASLDCILFDDILERVDDPLAVIRRLRALLKDDGVVICSINNAQNFSVISSIFTNDLQYKESGLLDNGHLRLFTLSSIYKMLLDADFLPQLRHAVIMPCSDEFLQAAIPLAQYFRIHPTQIHTRLSTFRYIVSATALPTVAEAEEPMSFVVCCNDSEQLENNLAASPCFRSGQHELLVITDARSAAEGINSGLSKARHDLVVAVHQDIYLPDGWPARLQSQWRKASEDFGPLGVAGVFGVAPQADGKRRTGPVINGEQLIAPGYALPAPAVSLDEIALIFPKGTDLRLDSALGWHCYGTDAVLQARRNGLQAAILDAPCLHNTRFAGLQADFVMSAMALGQKWKEHRPLHTTCIRLDENDGMAGW
jgi:SAM-dependent methyltransferase